MAGRLRLETAAIAPAEIDRRIAFGASCQG